MSLSLEEYREELVSKILSAVSQDEVNCFINTALKALEQNKINGHIISRFVEKMTRDLRLFDPMKKDAQQWSNIKIARILFIRIKNNLNETIN